MIGGQRATQSEGKQEDASAASAEQPAVMEGSDAPDSTTNEDTTTTPSAAPDAAAGDDDNPTDIDRSSGTVSFSGELKKRGDKGFVGSKVFVKRFWRLYDDEALLCYFKSEKDTSEIGHIDLKGALLIEKAPGKPSGKFSITMKTTARVWHLQADKPEKADEWIGKLSAHIKPFTPEAAEETLPDDKGARQSSMPAGESGNWAAASATGARNAEKAREAREAAAAASAAAVPVHRSPQAIAAVNRATLADVADLPPSKSSRYAPPEVLSATPAHAAAAAPGAAGLQLFSGDGTVLVDEVVQVDLDADSAAVIPNLPRCAVPESFSVRAADAAASPAPLATEISYHVDPRTPETLLAMCVGEKMTVAVPRRANDAGFRGADTLTLEGVVNFSRQDAADGGNADDDDDDDAKAAAGPSTFVLAPSEQDGAAGAAGTFHFLNTKDVISYTPANPKSFADAHARVRFAPATAPAGSSQTLRLQYALKKDAMPWNAQYHVVLAPNEATAHISGFFVVENDTGRDWSAQTALTLVATDKPKSKKDDKKEKSTEEKAGDAAAGAAASKFGGLGALAAGALAAVGGGEKKEAPPPERTYTTPFHSTTSLPDDRKTQLAFLSCAGVPVRSMDLCSFDTPKFTTLAQKAPSHGAGSMTVTASTVIEIHNTAAGAALPKVGDAAPTPLGAGLATPGGLGYMPLPAGSAMLTRQSPQGLGTEVVARNAAVAHTDVLSTLRFSVEDLSGVTATRTQTGFNYDTARNFIIESFEIKVVNGRDEPVHVVVEDSLYRWRHWEITHTSAPFIAHPNVAAQRSIRWNVAIAAGKDTTISYTVFYSRIPADKN